MSDEDDKPGDDITGKLVEDKELRITGTSVTPESSPRSTNVQQVKS